VDSELNLDESSESTEPFRCCKSVIYLPKSTLFLEVL